MPRPNSDQPARRNALVFSTKCASPAESLLQSMKTQMRLLFAVLIGVVLLSPRTTPERTRIPTVAEDIVATSEVRRGSEIGDVLVVERPVGASEATQSSVFVLDAEGVQLRRVAVEYGRGSASLIQISGVSCGDRIVVSDMRAWDAFERLQLRSR
jgi:hypothetical protein